MPCWYRAKNSTTGAWNKINITQDSCQSFNTKYPSYEFCWFPDNVTPDSNSTCHADVKSCWYKSRTDPSNTGKFTNITSESDCAKYCAASGYTFHWGTSTDAPNICAGTGETDCTTSAWSDWSTCEPCGGSGTQTRTRQVINQPSSGGKQCPDLTESKSCTSQVCPVDCVMGEWGPWSECVGQCGTTGWQERERDYITQPTWNGQPCGEPRETGTCEMPACQVLKNCYYQLSYNGKPYGWNFWSSNVPNCDSAREYLENWISQYPGYSVEVVFSDTTPTASPTTAPQPVNCVYTSADMVSNGCISSSCTLNQYVSGTCRELAPCGTTGFIPVENTITTEAKNGGTACPERYTKRSCNAQACPSPVDCVYSRQSAGNVCVRKNCTPEAYWTGQCGSSVQPDCGTQGYVPYTNVIKTYAANGGQTCPDQYGDQSVTCNGPACADSPIDCKYTRYSGGTVCVKKSCTPEAYWTGKCGSTAELLAPCGTQGYIPHTNVIDTYAANGGLQCPNRYGDQSVTCNAPACSPGEDDSTPKKYCWYQRKENTVSTRFLNPDGTLGGVGSWLSYTWARQSIPVTQSQCATLWQDTQPPIKYIWIRKKSDPNYPNTAYKIYTDTDHTGEDLNRVLNKPWASKYDFLFTGITVVKAAAGTEYAQIKPSGAY